jgi:hypothetical protein
MHRILSCALLAAAATLAACGGGGGGGSIAPWAASTSAASAALATPGSATSSADAHSVTLVGGDGGTRGCAGGQYGFATSPCTVTATAAASGTYAFDWTYTSADDSGPGADLFGMIVDGKVVPLSDPGGPLTQSGHRQVAVNGSIAFYLNCTDCTDGGAQAMVTGFDRQ